MRTFEFQLRIRFNKSTAWCRSFQDIKHSKIISPASVVI